ncbi:DUF6584 family protein [Lentzea indica]|uniref:DUF6584 family protein n=1 Tax=Lentzea indica TaxID=2604800 RepID=UPI001FE8FEB9|nr:DUF6584 family protein [Lentzea indica]
MPVELTLHKAAEELRRGDLASVLRARQRVAGLVGTYPHRLDLRERLAEVYRTLGQPAQAGRWTYLSEERDPEETQAFERAYRRAEARLGALSWQGRVDEAPPKPHGPAWPPSTWRRASSCSTSSTPPRTRRRRGAPA